MKLFDVEYEVAGQPYACNIYWTIFSIKHILWHDSSDEFQKKQWKTKKLSTYYMVFNIRKIYGNSSKLNFCYQIIHKDKIYLIVAIAMAKICLYNTTHNIGFLKFIFLDCGIITVLILATILGLKISNQSIQRSGSLRLRALLTFELLNWFKSGVQNIFIRAWLKYWKKKLKTKKIVLYFGLCYNYMF